MKVIVCDDDPVARVAMVELVKGFPDLEVVEASDGGEAWNRLQESVPLLCCTSIRLPKLSGIDLLRRVRQTSHLRKLPFVMTALAADTTEVIEAIRLGAIDCIPKPIDSRQTREYMAQVLQRVWATVVEERRFTLKRLGVTPEKLDQNYHAFEAQIDKVSAELAAGGGETDAGVLRRRLPGLVTSCDTLGIWRGEEALQGLLAAPAAKVQIFGVLASVRAMVHHQLEQVR